MGLSLDKRPPHTNGKEETCYSSEGSQCGLENECREQTFVNCVCQVLSLCLLNHVEDGKSGALG